MVRALLVGAAVVIVASFIQAVVFLAVPMDWVSTARNQSLRPCFADPSDVAMEAAFQRWEDAYKQEKGAEYKPLRAVIPDGMFAGEQVMDTCFAVEDRLGRVTFWQRPYVDGDIVDVPFWNPYPKDK